MIDFENGAIFKLKPDNGKSARLVEDLLIPGETVIGSYTVVRDFVVFTDKRVISCNMQGVTGVKRDYFYALQQDFRILHRNCRDLGSGQ